MGPFSSPFCSLGPRVLKGAETGGFTRTMNPPAMCEMQLEKDKSDVLSTAILGDTRNASMETAAQFREAVSIGPI